MQLSGVCYLRINAFALALLLLMSAFTFAQLFLASELIDCMQSRQRANRPCETPSEASSLFQAFGSLVTCI